MIAADLANVQVWVATTPVDMRRSFDGLAEVVGSFLGHDPLSGGLVVFHNKGGHVIKMCQPTGHALRSTELGAPQRGASLSSLIALCLPLD
ncbi:MAG: IS66 family insertion sequence element accessory protein TnpB [Planctomycetales bacterium]|nr:IS66 family insertion sequence element accessory protein TnpB [Planctomycetales bacterium]